MNTYTHSHKEVQEKLDTRKSKVIFKDNAKLPDLATLLNKLVIESIPTYSLYKNGAKHPQCDYSRRRSAEDAYLLAKEQFPGITLKKIDDALLRLRSRNIISRGFCGTVHRYVHTPFIQNNTEALGKVKAALGELNIQSEKAIQRSKCPRRAGK